MLLRVVKMEFHPSNVKAFDSLFDRIHVRIESMPGCHQVLLLHGHGDGAVRTTLSWWEDEIHLEAYRKSELFGEVWPKTKALFSAPPVAWSSAWPESEPFPSAE
ncbi:MAG: antibiotic biosynthesis monooxygenase [Crocinitomicaceae bacterium]|nr:antibiotic biosynthesis monooxygenase [Crocinitomicaceae bacterium]